MTLWLTLWWGCDNSSKYSHNFASHLADTLTLLDHDKMKFKADTITAFLIRGDVLTASRFREILKMHSGITLTLGQRSPNADLHWLDSDLISKLLEIFEKMKTFGSFY